MQTPYLPHSAAAAGRAGGFTLIELMVTLTVLGILSAVALPAYQQYLQRGWRADARTVLLDNAQFMARFYSQNLKYRTSDTTPVAPTLPTTYSPQGSTSSNAKYAITVSASDDSSFTLTATPSGWTDSKCGNLTLNHLGEKGASQSGANATECWTR